MNKFVCLTCGQYCYSAATEETALNDHCPYFECDGKVVLVEEGCSETLLNASDK